MKERKDNEQGNGSPESSVQICLEQFSQLKQGGKLLKIFASSLMNMQGWYSPICGLAWELKKVRYSRYYFDLKVSRAQYRKLSTNDPNNTGLELTLEEITRRILLPTPVSSDATTGAIIGRSDTFKMTSGLPRKINRNGKDGSVGLARLVQLLPTPTAGLHKTSGMSAVAWEKRIQDNRQQDLNMNLYKMTGRSGKLNPTFVLEMMGFPVRWTLLPFLKTTLQ